MVDEGGVAAARQIVPAILGQLVVSATVPLLLAGAALAQAAPQTSPGADLRLVRDAGPARWSTLSLRGRDTDVAVYVMHDDRPKPVVVLLHGSGCLPTVTIDSDGAVASTSLFQDVLPAALARVHVAMIEKRGVAPVRFTAGMSQVARLAAFDRAGEACSPEFFAQATKDARVDDAATLVDALREQPWVSGVVLLGHSEGTHVATGVLRVRPSAVAAAGLFASAGPTPFWGGAYADAASPAASRAAFERNLDVMRMLQRADDATMHEGLPARRWKSYWIQSTPLEDVRDSDVPLFVAHGSRDGSLLPSDLFVMESLRHNPGRPIRYLVVQNGDHAFETPAHVSRVKVLFDDFIAWALDPQRATGIRVLP